MSSPSSSGSAPSTGGGNGSLVGPGGFQARCFDEFLSCQHLYRTPQLPEIIECCHAGCQVRVIHLLRYVDSPHSYGQTCLRTYPYLQHLLSVMAGVAVVLVMFLIVLITGRCQRAVRRRRNTTRRDEEQPAVRLFLSLCATELTVRDLTGISAAGRRNRRTNDGQRPRQHPDEGVFWRRHRAARRVVWTLTMLSNRKPRTGQSAKTHFDVGRSTDIAYAPDQPLPPKVQLGAASAVAGRGSQRSLGLVRDSAATQWRDISLAASVGRTRRSTRTRSADGCDWILFGSCPWLPVCPLMMDRMLIGRAVRVGAYHDDAREAAATSGRLQPFFSDTPRRRWQGVVSGRVRP